MTSFITSFDHTIGNTNGVYLFVDASLPSQPGFTALLESTLFFPTPTHGRCMDFWYHMYGKDMGTLNIYSNVSNKNVLLWSHSGDKGNQWLNGKISIKSSRSFRVNIVAVLGNGALSNIAIDDIDFVERACPSDVLEELPSTMPASTTRSTAPAKPKGKLINKCDFETDFCIWTNSTTSRHKWLRVQGQLGKISPGNNFSNFNK